jgi:hypothetical protein
MPVAFAVTLIVLYAAVFERGSGGVRISLRLRRRGGIARAATAFFSGRCCKAWCHVPEQVVHTLRRSRHSLAGRRCLAAVLSSLARARYLDGGVGAGKLFTLLVSPHDPWYFTWLVPFLVLSLLTAAHVWLTGACTLMYVLPDPTGLAVQSLIYLPFIVLLLLQFFLPSASLHRRFLHANRRAQSVQRLNRPVPDPRRYFEAVGEQRSRSRRGAGVPVSGNHQSLQPLLCTTCPRTYEELEPPADMSWELFTRIVDQYPRFPGWCCTGSANR